MTQNDYFDHLLASAGNNQMPTLNRDIQQLNLASNSISTIKSKEFFGKKFRNLQKLYLNSNRVSRIDLRAFFKLTGLIELDLSENLISSLSYDRVMINDHSKADSISDEGDSNNNNTFLEETKENLSLSFEKQQQKRERLFYGKSFLQDLSQLHLINLTSNQLTSIERYTFSPLTQLRQLYLSR